MVRKTKTKPVGRKNTTIRAIPKPLYRKIVSIKLEMEQKNKKTGKKQKVTLLEAGIELVRRVK